MGLLLSSEVLRPSAETRMVPHSEDSLQSASGARLFIDPVIVGTSTKGGVMDCMHVEMTKLLFSHRSCH